MRAIELAQTREMTDQAPPFCGDCKWFGERRDELAFDYCAAADPIGVPCWVVLGVPRWVARSDYDACGPSGKHFKPREAAA